MTMVPDGASCYICLDEGPDEAGKPLVRDCSCRGEAGFAHLSCIVKFAEQKSQQAADVDADLDVFTDPWYVCTNCKQPFRNRLSRDLSSAFVSFAEEGHVHPGNSVDDKLKVMVALKLNVNTFINGLREVIEIGVDKNNLRRECEMLIKRFMDMVGQMKEDMKMDRWVHMPQTSYEYWMFSLVCGNFEAGGYEYWAALYNWDGTKASYKMAIAYYTKARIIYNLIGEDAKSKDVEVKIIMIREKLAKFNNCDATDYAAVLLQKAKDIYEHDVKVSGLASEKTITSGFNYVNMLGSAHRGIEGERLLVKLAALSRRVHGPNHNCTLMADKGLRKIKSRYVYVMPDNVPPRSCDDWKDEFLALRYENDGKICVLSGPITRPRREEKEKTFRVSSYLIVPNNECPIICHGLVGASHLNGKLGFVRNVRRNETVIGAPAVADCVLFVVNFEDMSLKPKLVKPVNVRIAFELPSEE